MTRFILVFLLVSDLIISTIHVQFFFSQQSHQTITIADAKQYFFQVATEEKRICFDDPDDYLISVGIVKRMGEEYYSVGITYYDENDGTRNTLSANITMDLSLSDGFYGNNIGDWHLQKKSDSRESWEKEKKTRKAMEGWNDPTMSAPLWDYTQKYDFYLREGDFYDVISTLYESSGGILDFNKPTGSVIIPEDYEMQYDEALQYAWISFLEDKKFSGDMDVVAVSSICIRKTPEAVQKIRERLPDFPDDGVIWDIMFYLPVELDNGETIYRFLYYPGWIYRAS